MFTINDAGTWLGTANEDRDSPENDDPDEQLDGLNKALLSSRNSASIYRGRQGEISNKELSLEDQATGLKARARILVSWITSTLTRVHVNSNAYNQIPLVEASSQGPYTPQTPATVIDPYRRPSFLQTGRQILSYSWSNLLLVFAPIGIFTYLIDAYPPLVFASNALAVIPLSNLLTLATEFIAHDMGDSIGAILNITSGNLVEMIIFSALANHNIRIVQAALLGSIFVNLLLILGTSVLVGSLRHRELAHNIASAQTLTCLLALSLFSMLIPSAFYHSFRDAEVANKAVLILSRASSVLLLLIYIIYLLFHLKSHAYLTKSMPAHFPISENNHGLATQRNSLLDFPRTSDAQSVPPPMRLRSRDARVFQPTYGPYNATEVHKVDKEKESTPHTPARSDPGMIENRASCDLEHDRVQDHSHLRSANSASTPPLGTAKYSANPRNNEVTTTHEHDSEPSSTPHALPYNTGALPINSSDLSSATTADISRPASLLLLLTCSTFVSISAFLLTNTIEAVVASTPLSATFIGLIILPIAGNTAEHITAMTVAWKNKMDLAIGVSVGSSIQIALCVTPAVVLLGWAMGEDMSLHFGLFETVTLVAATGVVVVVIHNGRTNYLQGWLLCACYVILGFGAYLHPTPTEQI